jgi:hypothetical protein
MKIGLNLRLNKIREAIYLALFAIMILPSYSYGQSFGVEEDYYLFPIQPGVRNTLAGTMGELRRSHFHTGIDIRTGGMQGLPVLAAAEGTISRIVISPSGYGNALYLLHGNGETTVYAHLKEFSQEIQEYARKEQYGKQSFQVNLFPSKGTFVFSKGDTIAISGNSGSSGGPHLHFDIRDKNQNVLNPLNFNFEEIVDYRSPEVRKVALKTMDINSRINHQFGRFEFKARKVGINWVIDSAISVYGRIGVELYAYDRQDGTRFRTGITEIKMKLDEENIFNQVIDNLSFSKSRNFYSHINYEKIRDTGDRFHKLYVDEGNELDIYTTNSHRGVMSFDQPCDHIISIDMFDTYRNESNLTIPVVCSMPESESTSPIFDLEEIELNSFKILGNTLIISADQIDVNPDELSATVYVLDHGMELKPFYANKNINVYLWDLRDGVPDSIDLCNSIIKPGLEAMIPSAVPFKFYSNYLDASFSTKTLFDTAYLHIQHNKSFMDEGELFIFGTDSYPVRSNIEVKLKPSHVYPDKELTHVYLVDDSGNFGFSGGEWKENHVIFKTRNFGSYTLLTDSISPKVKALIINHDKLVFRIGDELSGIKEFNMFVNDSWVLMNYDPKLKQIWSEKLNASKPFEGELVLSVIDNAGNENLYKSNIAKYESANRFRGGQQPGHGGRRRRLLALAQPGYGGGRGHL